MSFEKLQSKNVVGVMSSLPRKEGGENTPISHMKNGGDNSADLILRVSTSPQRRKRSATFSTSPRTGKEKYKSPMAALVMFASMEDTEVDAARLLTQMAKGSSSKLPPFLLNKAGVEEAHAATATTGPAGKAMSMKSKVSSNICSSDSSSSGKKEGAETRERSDSLDKLAETASAMGDLGSTYNASASAEMVLTLPPMPIKNSFDLTTGIAADGRRRTNRGRSVVPDFASFATGGVVRSLPPQGKGMAGSADSSAGGSSSGHQSGIATTAQDGAWRNMSGAEYEPLRRASRASSMGSTGSDFGTRMRAHTVGDGPQAQMNRMTDMVGIYGPEERRARIARFLEKRKRRVWSRKVKYDVRKNFADSRMRIKGRFVKKEDEAAIGAVMDLVDGGGDKGRGRSRSRSRSTSAVDDAGPSAKTARKGSQGPH